MKKIILIVVLVIPVVIFVFLKFFGTNHFEVSVFHQERTATTPDCIQQFPHKVHMPEGMKGSEQPINIVHIADEPRKEDLIRTNRIYDGLIDYDGVKLVSLKPGVFPSASLSSYKIKNGISDDRWGVVGYERNKYDEFVQCQLGIMQDTTFAYVVIDEQSLVRGYYAANDEEADRLMLEVKILLGVGGS